VAPDLSAARRRVTPRIVATPLAPLELPQRRIAPRRVAPAVVAAALPGPGRERLAGDAVLVVTTGQQPGLFTGPLYTVYKALSAVALARRLERLWAQDGGPAVVPVFWVAGDDHDFAEANHATLLDARGEVAEIRLRERAPEAPLLPLARERCGEEIRGALARLREVAPETEFKEEVLAWLEAAYRPEATLADAFAEALAALCGPRGLVVLRAHDPGLKQVAAPWVLRGLSVTLPDGYTPVLLEAKLGRDRLRPEGDGFVTRRSEERFTRAMLEAVAEREPERLSPNVLLRPVIEAVLLPTVAYAGGPAELGYLPEAAPLYEAMRSPVARQTPVPRWSGVLVDARVDKLLTRYDLTLEDLQGRPGELEARLVRETLPPELDARFGELRGALEARYAGLADAVAQVDPTLARSVQSAKHGALAGAREIEKKLLASLKRENEALVRQVGRGRALVHPRGEPQERVLTLASFLIRYGADLVDALEQEVARWADPS
jgi:bacillithiol synthase